MVSLSTPGRTCVGSLTTRAGDGDRLSQAVRERLEALDSTQGVDRAFSHQPVIERTSIFDKVVSKHIEENPNAIILNAGCGMCVRFFRLKPPPTVTWIDADLAPVIELKKQVLSGLWELPANYTLDVLDLIQTIPVEKTPYTLMVLEGVLSYIPEARAHNVVQGHVVFDVLWHTRKSLGSDQKWKYKEGQWDLNVLEMHYYDMGEHRGAVIMEVDDGRMATP